MNARKDLCRAAGSAPSNPIFLACRSLSASPSQHSCFGIPLKAQHCCPFLTLHVARAPTRRARKHEGFPEMLSRLTKPKVLCCTLGDARFARLGECSLISIRLKRGAACQKTSSGVRGPQPLPSAIARGDMRGASGTIAFSQLVPIFLNGREF